MSASQFPPADGNHQWGLIIENGFLIVRFQHPIEWVKLEPENALAIAGAFIRMAMEIKTGGPVDGVKIEKLVGDSKLDAVLDLKHGMLLNRVKLMLRQFREQPLSFERQAAMIVDSIFHEIS